jgi:hypothetical protein
VWKVALALVILVALILDEVYEFAGFFFGFVPRNLQEGGVAVIVFLAIIGVWFLAEDLVDKELCN